MSTNTESVRNPGEIISTIVEAVTGFTLDEMPLETQKLMIKQCSEMFIGYVINFTKSKYGDKPAQQLKGIAIYDTPELFESNPDLVPIFSEAYNSFVENMS